MSGQQIDIASHLILLDYFYKYILFQTFPEIFSPNPNWEQDSAIMEDYSSILDKSSYAQFQHDLSEMKLILISVN